MRRGISAALFGLALSLVLISAAVVLAGNIHVGPNSTVVIKDDSGQPIATIKTGPDGSADVNWSTDEDGDHDVNIENANHCDIQLHGPGPDKITDCDVHGDHNTINHDGGGGGETQADSYGEGNGHGGQDGAVQHVEGPGPTHLQSTKSRDPH